MICISQFKAVLFHAAALMAFFGAFRVSELMVRSCSVSSDSTFLSLDVEVVGGSVQIRLCCSKTDQLLKGTQVVLGPCGDRGLWVVTSHALKAIGLVGRCFCTHSF